MPSLPAKRVSTRIADRLRAAGVTQTAAAKALHMSQSAFSRRYLGYVEYRASEIQALADLLELSVAELVGDPAEASA